MQLNNYLQQVFRNQTTLSWDMRPPGNEHNGEWLAIAYGAYSNSSEQMDSN
jgi:hypothetical protein